MLTNKNLSMMFDCRECGEDEERKKAYGCERDTEKTIWETDYCFVCSGLDRECAFCEGSNHIPVHRCPRALMHEVMWLLPYFTDWRISNRVAWPDGRSRLNQPVKLSDSFDFIDRLIYEAQQNEPKSTSSS
jgi:hypothetical protein